MLLRPRKNFKSYYSKINAKQREILRRYMAYIEKGYYYIEVDPGKSIIVKNKNNNKTRLFVEKYGYEVAKEHLKWLSTSILNTGENAYIGCLQNVSPLHFKEYGYEVYAFTYKDYETKSFKDQYYVKMLYNKATKKINVIIHESGDY